MDDGDDIVGPAGQHVKHAPLSFLGVGIVKTSFQMPTGDIANRKTKKQNQIDSITLRVNREQVFKECAHSLMTKLATINHLQGVELWN